MIIEQARCTNGKNTYCKLATIKMSDRKLDWTFFIFERLNEISVIKECRDVPSLVDLHISPLLVMCCSQEDVPSSILGNHTEKLDEVQAFAGQYWNTKAVVGKHWSCGRKILKHIRAASNPADSSQSRGKGTAGAILSPFPEVSVN